MRVEISFNVCRVCLQNCEDKMASIYEPCKDPTSEMLYRRLERCGGIKVLTDPELPNKICEKCNAFLNIVHKFQAMCKSSDEYLRDFICKPSDANTSLEGENDFYGDAEYLHEYKPEVKNTTVAEVLQQAGHKIDETEINYEEIDAIAEMWLNDNDEDDEDQNTNTVEKELPKENSIKIEPELRRSNRPKKTLDISSDGAAIIRVKQSKRLLKPEKQIHICDICGNSYDRNYALVAHMRRHRNEKNHECEICHKAFHLNFQLTRHMRKHTGARPYTCQYCNRNFTDRSTMVKHERIHRNERPYTCETCGKSFTYSNVLKVHQLTHTGEKPFICGICLKRFSRAHHLRAHLETQQHQSDPRSKILLKQIKREVEHFDDD